jgi:hypothetical protein
MIQVARKNDFLSLDGAHIGEPIRKCFMIFLAIGFTSMVGADWFADVREATKHCFMGGLNLCLWIQVLQADDRWH